MKVQLSEILFSLAHQHRLHKPDGQKKCDQGAAAITDEWQSQTRYRQQAHIHADAYKCLKKEDGGNAGNDQFADQILAKQCGAQDAPQDKTEQENDDQRTKHQPHLFREHGKNEVRMLHAQKPELALGALQVSLAPKTA